MAVKIRLTRGGKKRDPHYRIVIADSRTKRDGKVIERVGIYHPKENPSRIEVKSDRVQHWLSVGAQPTETVRKLLTLTGDWSIFTGKADAENRVKVRAPREAFTSARTGSVISEDAVIESKKAEKANEKPASSEEE